MNKKQPQNESEQLSSRFKAVWNRLTDDEIASYKSDETEFFETLQEKYHITRTEAENKIREMKTSLHKHAA